MSVSIRKAVIPVGGFGTRMFPATRVVPKALLPVPDCPLIGRVVDEAVRAGLTEIILVGDERAELIARHFAAIPELERHFRDKGAPERVSLAGSGLPPGVRLKTVHQPVPLGLGHAVHCARHEVGSEAFAVLLPDVLVAARGEENDLADMLERFERSGCAQVLVETVSAASVAEYGIVDIGGSLPAPGESAPLLGLVEKPAPGEAPSNLAVVGRYVLPAEIMPLLDQTSAGAGGEIQLTDAIAALLSRAEVHAFLMRGRSFDCGNPRGYVEAFMYYVMRHPELGEFAHSLLSDNG